MIPNRTYTPVRRLPAPHLLDTGGLVRQVPLRYAGYAETYARATLCVSPYMVATPKGYTKHYYAESERIASRIGGGGTVN